MKKNTDTLVAKITREIFAATDSEFRIMLVTDDEGNQHKIVGEFPQPTLEMRYEIDGKWEVNGYGRQMKVDSIRFVKPTSTQEVLCFLRRIGDFPWRASRILCDAIGNRIVDDLENVTAEEIVQHCRVSEERAQGTLDRMKRFLGNAQLVAEIASLVEGCGIPQTAIKDIASKWSGLACEVIRKNPFRLLEIDGIGFVKADKVYLKLGGRRDRLKRQTLAVWYCIQRQDSTWLSVAQARREATAILDTPPTEKSIRLGTRVGLLTVRDKQISITQWATQEEYVAKKLHLLSLEPGLGGIDDARLSETQREQLAIATSAKCGALVGGPGTGKTFTAAALLKHLLDSGVSPEAIAVVAPTGKAAVRLTEVMQGLDVRLTARTIHSFCGVRRTNQDGSTVLDEDEKFVRYVMVDESSMIPIPLMHSLLRCVPPSAYVLFLGDVGQLPPIGHGAPLRDIVAATSTIPVGRLTEVRRNAGDIVRVCAEIADGKAYLPSPYAAEKSGRNILHMERSSAGILPVVEAIFREPPPGINPHTEIQVLSPMKKQEAALGTKVINQKIRAIVNPTALGDLDRGDKVYVKKNSELDRLERHENKPWSWAGSTYVANGEFGMVVDQVEKTADHNAGFVVKLDAPERFVLISQRSLVDYGWATTVHKSQGSEWPLVIYLADRSFAIMGSRQLFYTAISRAKRYAITIGQMSAIQSQVRKNVISNRVTRLAELLAECESQPGTQTTHEEPEECQLEQLVEF